MGGISEYFSRTALEISIPCKRDPGMAAQGKTGIILSTPVMIRSAGVDWENLEGEALQAAEDTAASAMIESAAQLMPLLNDPKVITGKLVSTPKTLQDTIGSRGGSISGWGFLNQPPPVETSYFAMASTVRTSYPNISRAGQWCFSPTGAPVAIITGRLASQRALKPREQPGGT